MKTELSGLCPNETMQRNAAKIIFDDDPHPQDKFVYTPPVLIVDTQDIWDEYAELIQALSKFRKRWIERHQNLKKGEEPIK